MSKGKNVMKAGVIGLGVGAHHFRALNSHGNCQVVAISDFSKSKSKALVDRHPDIVVVENFVEMLKCDSIELVSIASYDQYHYEQIIRAIEHQKHVFVEKPLCQKFEETQHVRDLLESNPKIALSMNMVLRTCPLFQKVREEIQMKMYGEVFYLESDYLWGRIHKLTTGWRRELVDYSIILGAAIHVIDLSMWLLGERPDEVHAFGNNIATRTTEFQVNSFSVMLIKFPSGVVAKVSGNGGCVHPHFHSLKVFGSEKTVYHDLSATNTFSRKGMEVETQYMEEAYPGKEFRGEVVTSFVDSIQNIGSPMVSVEDVFSVMSVCFAAEKSIKTGKACEVTYI